MKRKQEISDNYLWGYTMKRTMGRLLARTERFSVHRVGLFTTVTRDNRTGRTIAIKRTYPVR